MRNVYRNGLTNTTGFLADSVLKTKERNSGNFTKRVKKIELALTREQVDKRWPEGIGSKIGLLLMYPKKSV
jgi:hypothetical protein